ncbi:MAG: histidine kinase dimerization/phospho-acceptor domain-containing protein, partial [Myxococcales bacterium]
MDHSDKLRQHADALFEEHRQSIYRHTDRLFAYLMLAQWAFAVVLAVFVSPWSWEGQVRSVNVHVYAALGIGGLLTLMPVALAFKLPGHALTRNVIAATQMLWSALLIHLTGGRIETHFHVFGSLAFVAFYRDWKVLIPATVVVAGDHLLRQLFWPQSVFGMANPEWWRFLEHAGWVVFEDTILVLSCLRATREMREIALRQAEVELLSASEREKSRALDEALQELKRSQEKQVRVEKLAAVGQLAASVGHELRNPIAAVRNALTYLEKKLSSPEGIASAAADPRIPRFMGVMNTELNNCSRIISDLLDFARERPPVRRDCPLHPLVEEALGVVPARANVQLLNEVPQELPIPSLDRDQFRQVLINLVQNASEAVPAEAQGTVRVRASGGGPAPWRIEVVDDGGGLNRERILQKAIERGLVPAGQTLSDNEIYNLIFEAGFSTAEQVTNLSGRGVG